MAVPKLPPRKNSIELMLIADASIWGRTIRDTVAARGVFTNPNPAPSNPVKMAMTHTDDPVLVERPSTARSIRGDPTQTGRRAPTQSVIQPDKTPNIDVDIAPGTMVRPTSRADKLCVTPNPPKDTDGRREGSGRGWVRELQGRWPGLLG